MSDRFQVQVDDAAVKAAIAQLGPLADALTKPASAVSAAHIKEEMQSRVARATGRTAARIDITEVDDGYIVHTSDVNPLTGSYLHELHVGLYLEKGTRKGKRGSHASGARPWFFVSAQLEERAHEHRIADALQAAGDQVGLGA